jgi:hypothetical protein
MLGGIASSLLELPAPGRGHDASAGAVFQISGFLR